MGLPWFRLYSEFRNDPKVRTMPEAFQIRLVRLLCLRCEGPTESLTEDEIAYALDCQPLELPNLKREFIRKGFIEEDWSVTHWSARQFSSDSSTSRVRKFRENQAMKQHETFHETDMKRNETVTVTAPEQNRTEQTREEQKKPTPKAAPSSFTLPLDIHHETWKAFEEMRRKIRAPLTDRARQNIIADLRRLQLSGHDPDEVLNQSITRGWRGVFEIGGNGSNGTNHGSPAKQRIDGARRVLAEIAIERGLVTPPGADGEPDPTLPFAGSGGEHRGVFQGLRAAGAEVLAPSRGGSGRGSPN